MQQRMDRAQGYAQDVAGDYVQNYGVTRKWRVGEAPSFRNLHATGCIMFIITFYSYTFLQFFHSGWIHLFTVVTLAASLYIITFERNSPKKLHLFTTVLVGLVWGTFFGQINFDNFTYYMYMYDYSRTYYDVVPTIPADAVADGGRLLFAKETRVDKSSAVGYAADDGHKYCVAPIRDLTDTTNVEYWAIGIDCCGWQGGFDCGNAMNEEARGGIVVFNHKGVFGRPTRIENFKAATQKAAATYDLVASQRPLYVEWVDKPALENASGYYKTASWVFFTVVSVVWCGLFFAALKPRYQKPLSPV